MAVPVVVARKRTRPLIGLAIAVGFGVYSISLGLWIGVVVFVVVAAYLGYGLVRNRPALVIDEHGVQVGSRVVPWQDVTDVEVVRNRVAPAPMLVVRTANGRPMRVMLRDLDKPTPEILQAMDGYRR